MASINNEMKGFYSKNNEKAKDWISTMLIT